MVYEALVRARFTDRSAYAIHQKVASLLAREAADTRDYLYEYSPDTAELYLRSSAPAGRDFADWRNLEALKAGGRYRVFGRIALSFERIEGLTATTIRVPGELAKALKRVFARNAGLEFETLDAYSTRPVWIEKPSRKPIHFTPIHFEGVARVRDVAAANRVLEQGYGRGKGFGFGVIHFQQVAL